MIGHYIALIKRELWEHRAIFVTPIVIALVMTLLTMMALAFTGDFQRELNAAIFAVQNAAGEMQLRALLTGAFVLTSQPFVLGLGILTVFYALDSLYAERKDKSILFWRSLPVTDAETVTSKLLTAIVVIPAATIVGIIVAHLTNLIITGIWVSSKGGDAGTLIWGSVPLLDNWLAMILFLYATVIWMSPFVGWFLFVSAWTKRAPFMMAFLPLVLVTIFEGIFLRSAHFADAVWGRLVQMPIFAISGMDIEEFIKDGESHMSMEMVSLLNHIDLAKFFSSVDTWIGIVVCGLLTTAAIYVRRYRDES